MIMETLSKVVIIHQRDERGEIAYSAFARDDNGMIIGAVDQTTGFFGEDQSEALVRHFMSNHHAMEWVKGNCRKLLGREDIDFLTTDAAPLIQSPNQQTRPTRRTNHRM